MKQTEAVLEVQGKRNMDSATKVPLNEKFNLTVSEAIIYFNIGRDKLYELAKENGNDYTLHNGKTILFKRKQLEKYLEKRSYI